VSRYLGSAGLTSIFDLLGPPDLGEELPVGEHLPRPLGKCFEQCHLPRRQAQEFAVEPEFARHAVEHEAADAEAGGGPGRRPCAPQHRPHAREQLAHAKRLGQVVVCSGVECFDLLILFGAGRQHEHGHLAGAAQPCYERYAVLVGQAQVHDQEIGGHRGYLALCCRH
jgi:hypothetical protein